MKARTLRLRDHDFADAWATSIEDHWDYKDFIADPRWRRDWISFDGVLHHPGNDRVYCGITSFDADIFWAWDRRSSEWIDCGFGAVRNPFDAKFHRSMELTSDGRTLYSATALLHDLDNYHEAPGGGVFAHDIASGKTTKLGIPIPHVYIQSIALDEPRGVIYGMHFTPERLSAFDLATNTGRDLGPIGPGMFMAQGENILLDDEGCAWSGWGLTRAWQNHWGVDAARLCKFDPRQDRIVYYNRGLPRRDGAHGFAHVEGLFNLGTGCLYASGDNGSLYRVDPSTAEASYLGTPIADRPSRLTSLALHDDGCAYGVTGRVGDCRLLRFDPREDRFELISDRIVDETGAALFQVHDVSLTPDGILYAGENDVPTRSGYLWEISEFA
ncbi:MAG: hypothetical protein CMJ18_27010 [Phycisphaeraceae bacterium]|nr:hypothetical protein [Phycisphaeraceae bacterium]